ncbi:hypothetical protein CW362_30490 [Streptomyces populi]|uniref:Peptidoglycan binding-like domain-containing protein n=1 Tax=Streptomyces populi TaxID=2058924 RepID=A0A2I0SH65_9ACTN|nr:hypothetical protein [Streptomyces populi]PKT69256.1 hypothetical protein CW362_30490 [Streptomyces populi]
MKSVNRRFRLGAATVGALTAAVLSMGTTPAAAAGDYSGLPYVSGGGAYSDDWGDEGILSMSQHAQSNATCLWQKILWADGYIQEEGADGYFGDITKGYTQHWQADRKGLTPDGAVGKATFGWADDQKIEYVSGSTADGQTLNLRYHGTYWSFPMVRDSYGHYQFQDYAGNWRAAGYDYRTCVNI